MTTIVTIDMGGTGATHAAGAREALSVPSMTDMGQSYAQANAAYADANTRVLKSGDTMTGQLNISSGGLLVSGNVNVRSSGATNGLVFIDTVNNRLGIGLNVAPYQFLSTLHVYGDANITNGIVTSNINVTTVNTTTINASTVLTNSGINVSAQAADAYVQANTARGTANDAYGAANTKLASAGGTLSGDLIITGNLTVSGNQTILNTEVLTTEDADIILLSNTSSTPALNAGLIINRGTSTNTFLRWDEATDKWGWSDSGTTTYYFEDLRQGLSTTNTTFATINTTFATLNTSAGTQNTAITTANDQANTARGQANTARDTANSAYGQANAAYSQANSAYGAANNRVLKAGDTMTGQLNVSSGGLLVTGNSNFDSGTLFVDSVNDRIGIGTTNPGYKLDVNGIVNIAQGSYLRKAFVDNTEEFLIRGDATSWNGFISYTPSGGTSNRGFKFGAWDNAGSRSDWVTFWNGNVGIGTTSPGAKLEVSGQDSSGTIIVSGDGGSNGVRLNLKSTAASGRQWMLMSGGTSHGGAGVFNIRDGTSGNNRLTIDSSGNVGIGTTSPSTKLHLYESGAADVLFRLTSANGTYDPLIQFTGQGNDITAEGFEIWYDNDVGDVHLSTTYPNDGATIHFHTRTGASKSTSNERLTILGNGNVGIGVTTPQRKLDVFGSGILASFGSQMSVGAIAGIHFGYSESSSNVDTYKKSAMVFERTDNHNQGGNASGKIHFLLHNSSSTSASGTNSAVLTLDTDGNATLGSARVGIGTTSPTAALHVSGTSGDSAPTFRINGTAAANTFNWAGSIMNSSLGSGYNTILLIGKLESNRNCGYIGFNHSGTNSSNTNFLTFGLHSVDNVLNITGAGNVGIGTTTPAAKLQVAGTGTFTGQLNTADIISLGYNVNGTVATSAARGIEFHVEGGRDYWIGKRAGGWTQPLDIAFYTGVRYHAHQSYNGHRFFVGGYDSVEAFSVGNGDNHVRVAYNLSVSGTITESSSIALKENISPITNALHSIAKLVGVTYDRKDGSAKNRAGLIKEEVEKVIPNIVNDDGIQYTNLIAYLVESIKELKAEIDVLKRQ